MIVIPCDALDFASIRAVIFFDLRNPCFNKKCDYFDSTQEAIVLVSSARQYQDSQGSSRTVESISGMIANQIWVYTRQRLHCCFF